jgi:hypothetical protein
MFIQYYWFIILDLFICTRMHNLHTISSVFVRGLFNDASNSSHSILYNYRLISEYWITNCKLSRLLNVDGNSFLGWLHRVDVELAMLIQFLGSYNARMWNWWC